MIGTFDHPFPPFPWFGCDNNYHRPSAMPGERSINKLIPIRTLFIDDACYLNPVSDAILLSQQWSWFLAVQG